MSCSCNPPPQTCCSDTEKATQPGNRKDLPLAVIGEVMTPAGPVPRVSTEMSTSDRLGIWKLRWGIGRMSYTVPPGLYSLGEPDAGSDVLVTANYRMTFDLLRSSLKERNIWILVLDTKGVNVWCAAGKGTFGTEELIKRIESSKLSAVINHKRLIVPQLGAPGVAAHEVRKQTGFQVMYGPVELRDIPAYLDNGRRATPAMRRKEFPLAERAAIVPMELVPASKWVFYIALGVALISGILGRGTFFEDALHYGSQSLFALILGTFAGAVVAPLMLPWLPGRAFALKGAFTGAAAALLIPFFILTTGFELSAWTLITISLSSYLTMNFTGSSTYTSLSGVKKEMKEAVPFQITAVSVGLILWLAALFTAGGGTA
ncbi:acetyl-CoA synthase subunit gamma [bacterium]|nr:acetyl-CoA synthase subunit gamma [bacterium]